MFANTLPCEMLLCYVSILKVTHFSKLITENNVFLLCKQQVYMQQAIRVFHFYGRADHQWLCDHMHAVRQYSRIVIFVLSFAHNNYILIFIHHYTGR